MAAPSAQREPPAAAERLRGSQQTPGTGLTYGAPDLEEILGARVDFVAGTLKPEVAARADRDLVAL